MASVSVTKVENARLQVSVSLLDPDWQELHPDHSTPFQVVELLRPCSVYPNGLFPGASLATDQPGRQVSRVYCFSNYLEWSRVTDEDIQEIGDDSPMYLTTNFFDQRKKGWAELTHTVKTGNTVGYCFNGTAYAISDTETVRTIVYKTVYKSIIKEKSVFKRLREIIDCAKIELFGADIEVLRVIAETLLESS